MQQHVHAADDDRPRMRPTARPEGMNMAQTTDDDTAAETNVTPFPSAAPEPQPRPKRRRRDRTGAARQAKFRSRNKGDRYERLSADALPPQSDAAPPIAPTVTQSAAPESVTLPARPLKIEA